MSGKDFITLMSEGNIGCLSVIMKMLESDGGFEDLIALCDMNIRGEQIWIAFKYICDQNMDSFIEKIAARDQNMIDELNKFVLAKCSNKHRAVPYGASTQQPEPLA